MEVPIVPTLIARSQLDPGRPGGVRNGASRGRRRAGAPCTLAGDTRPGSRGSKPVPGPVPTLMFSMLFHAFHVV